MTYLLRNIKILSNIDITNIDINNIDFNLIKIVAGFIIQNLHYILNLSFTGSIFLEKMKIAAVLPIYKKLNKPEVSNYKSIKDNKKFFVLF